MTVSDSHYSHFSNVILCLAEKKQLKITKSTVVELLKNHPNFPSTATMADTLNHFNIENLAVSINFQRLLEMPLPAIAQVHGNTQEDFVLINSIREGAVEIYNNKKKRKILTESEFAAIWNGTIILIDVKENSGEEDYHKNRQKEFFEFLRLPIITSFILIVIACKLLFVRSMHYTGVISLKIIGTLFCTALLTNELGLQSNVVKRFCGVNPRTNCEAVTTSAPPLFGWVSWAEIGFVYFSGGLLLLLLSDGSNFSYAILYLSILTFLSLPYTVWSIAHQAFIIKRWCILCLGVQGVLWLEFAFVMNTHAYHYTLSLFDFKNSLLFLVSFGLITVLLATIKPLIKNSLKVHPVTRSLNRFRLDFSLFRALLDTQLRVSIGNFKEEIFFGKWDAPLVVTVIYNPFCSPCRSKHKEVIKLASLYPDEVKINIRFLIDSTPNSLDDKNIFLRKLLSIAADKRIEALNEWFEMFDRYSWSSRYEGCPLPSVETLLKQHIDWCQFAQVRETPSIFVNENRFPLEIYTLSDLRNHVKNLLTPLSIHEHV